MPEPKTKIPINKRQVQTIGGVILVVLVLVLMVVSYPWLQLRAAKRFIQYGDFAKAEQILERLVISKPEWTEPRYQLTISQLYLGKGTEAAQTVIDLADAGKLHDVELAIIFMDVAEYLLNTGHGEVALELTHRVLAQREDAMLKQAVVEVGFMIAERYDLPLALDAINVALTQSEENWMFNRKAFNLLLTKALEAPPDLAEPALDQALTLYPNNIIAVTSKANLLSERLGSKEALNFLVEREPNLLDITNEEYLSTKRNLIFRLANTEPSADISKYTLGMPEDMVVEIALQGLNQAWQQQKSGYQFYQLAVVNPDVGFQYARNLFQMQKWADSRKILEEIRKNDPEYTEFEAVFAALDSKLETKSRVFLTQGFTPDMVQLSPGGEWLAWRRWEEQPWANEFMVSNLVLTNLSDKDEVFLGDSILFEWSPNGEYLSYLMVTSTGRGRLHVYSIADKKKYTFSENYDVVDFNWAGNNLMVQAERNDQIYLIHLVPPDWREVDEQKWELISDINQDNAWISLNKKTLLINRIGHSPREISFANELVSFSDWSPSGHLAIIQEENGDSWIYNYQNDELTALETPGKFAAWGGGDRIFWYFPVWEKLHVLVSLNNNGTLEEYLPYSFAVPLYDISISADGSTVVLVDDGVIHISSK